jgi:hypothetical protein
MDKGCGLERVIWALLSAVIPSKAAQFVVNQGKNLI